MNALILLVATAAVGVDYGYQPTGEGGLEYIIQIPPQFLNQDHPEVTSEVPQNLMGKIARYRITVGSDELPRRDLPANSSPLGTSPVRRGESPSDSLLSPKPSKLDVPEKFDPLRGTPNSDSSVDPRDRETPERTDPTTEANDKPRLSTFASNDKNNQRYTAFGDKEGSPQTADADRPWWALTTALVALFGSLGGNVYQGLAHANLRSRYQQLIDRMQSPARV